MAETLPDTATTIQKKTEPEFEAIETVSPSPLVPASSPLPIASFVEPIMEGAIPARAMYPFGWSRRDVRRSIGIFIAGFLALYFVWQIQTILPPFLIAFFLAALLDPTLRAMERRGRSRIHGILMIYLLCILFITLVVVLVVPPLTAQVESLSKNFNDYYTTAEENIDRILTQNEERLRSLGIKQRSVRDILATQSGQESWLQRTSRSLISGLTGFLQDLASKFFWLVIIPIAGFFFMRDYPTIRARIISLWPEQHQDRIDEVSRGVIAVFSKYIQGLLRICALYGSTMCIVYWIAGLKYGLLLGIMAGVFYAMPYIGQIMTGVIVGAVAYSMEQHMAFFALDIPANSTGYAIGMVLLTILVNNIFDQIIYAKVVGESVGLHPVVSIFALSAGATMFGIWGMLLAVPVAASIQIILCFFFPKLNRPPSPRLVEKSHAV